MEITIPWNPVKAMLHLAGKTDIRAWCNGVWVDQSSPYRTLVATDGLKLGILRTEEPSTDTGDWFLPGSVLASCKGFAGSAVVKRDGAYLGISCMGTTQHWQEKEAYRIVDWRRVFPRGESDGVARQFNPELLAPFVKVRETLRGKPGSKDIPGGVLLAHRSPAKDGPDPIVVQLLDVPEFVGVISPLGTVPVEAALRRTVPEWVWDRTGATAPAAETCDLA